MKSLRGIVVYNFTHDAFGIIIRYLWNTYVFVAYIDKKDFIPNIWDISDIRIATEEEAWKLKLKAL